MSKLRIALLLTIPLLVAPAQGDHNHKKHEHGTNHGGHDHSSAANLAPAGDHSDGHNAHTADFHVDGLDDVALADMHQHAVRHLGIGIMHGHSYGTAVHWASGWELRWIDYEVEGRIVRIYHATNKHDHAHRCTSHWDVHRAHYQHWERAH